MNKRILIFTLFLLSFFGLELNSYGIIENLSIDLSNSILQVNEKKINLENIENELTGINHKIHERYHTIPIEPYTVDIRYLYSLDEYPIRFIKINDKPFRSFDISFDHRINKHHATSILIHDIHINNDTTVEGLENLLKEKKVQYSKRLLNSDLVIIDSSMAEFVIEQVTFYKNKIYSIEIELDK
jgi:hypothetical protein